MQPTARQLQWLIALRLVIVTSIVLPYYLLNTFLPTTTVTGDEALVVEPATPPPAPRPTTPATEPDEPAAGPEAAGEAADEGAGAAPRGAAPTRLVIAERRTPGLDPARIYQAAGLVYLASLLYIILLRLAPRRPQLNAYVQFLGDLLLITALVYYTGGITSPFSLFYLVIIAVASTLLRRQAGFIVATSAYLLYAATLLSIYFGKLPPPEAQQQAGDPIYRLTYNLAVHFVGFYAVAVLTSVLAGRVSRAERELEEKSESLADLQVVHRDVIQSINSGLITTDLAGRITSVNRAGEEILGRPEGELAGRQAQELLGAARWEERTQRRSRAATPADGTRSEAEMTRHGETIFVGFSLSPLTDAAGVQRGWNVVFQDLTRWRELEEQVRMKDRMAAVGELAAGIAHEIGNPLAAISGSVQMLSHSAAYGPQEEKLLGILLKESQRLDRTIKGFLRFARPRERSTVEFDVARLLAENFELLSNSDEVADHHRLDLDLDPPSARLVADPDQVSQVFWNLARNALKAMPDGGELRIGGRCDDGIYRISVEDTGRGMTEQQRANLFHPFQSFFDSGTGIGMAIVYRIVKDHGGELRVDSAEAGGTRITVELPTVPRVPAAQIATVERP